MVAQGGGVLAFFRQWHRRCRNAERMPRSEEHTSELQSHHDLVCRLLLEKKKNSHKARKTTTTMRDDASVLPATTAAGGSALTRPPPGSAPVNASKSPPESSQTGSIRHRS